MSDRCSNSQWCPNYLHKTYTRATFKSNSWDFCSMGCAKQFLAECVCAICGKEMYPLDGIEVSLVRRRRATFHSECISDSTPLMSSAQNEAEYQQLIIEFANDFSI